MRTSIQTLQEFNPSTSEFASESLRPGLTEIEFPTIRDGSDYLEFEDEIKAYLGEPIEYLKQDPHFAKLWGTLIHQIKVSSQ